MRILQVHNRYSSGTGGEDSVLDSEKRLLESHGHYVEQMIFSNADTDCGTIGKRFLAAISAIWSVSAYRKVYARVRSMSLDIVHIHNTFMILSPAVFWAVRKAGVPVVCTMHNYRTICPASLLLRNNVPCTLCVGRYPWPAVIRKCRYKNSFALVLSIAATIFLHRTLKTYTRAVSGIIVLTEFQRNMFIAGNFPRDRIVVKPNFTIDRGPSQEYTENRKKRVVFIGLLAEEKGVDILLDAWSKLPSTEWELYIIGDGPDRSSLELRSANVSNIIWCGRLAQDDIQQILRSSSWLVLASKLFETFGMTIIEAFQTSTPVIAPGHGGMPELVNDQKNGFLFIPGDSDSLKASMESAFAMDISAWQHFSLAARQTYEERYTPEINYHQLMHIYEKAISYSKSLSRNK